MFSFMLFSQLATRDQRIKDTENRIETEVSHKGAVASLKLQILTAVMRWFIPLLGPVSRKSRELFGPEKPFVKLRPDHSVKLVFSYVVKGIKTNITAKFHASRRLRFGDTKRIMSPEIRPKSFGTLKKQATGLFWGILAGIKANISCSISIRLFLSNFYD